MPQRNPKRQTATWLEAGEIVGAEDPDRAGRVRKGREAGEQLGLDVLPGSEQVNRLEAGGEPRLDSSQ